MQINTCQNILIIKIESFIICELKSQMYEK
jgi:hypothetical protein